MACAASSACPVYPCAPPYLFCANTGMHAFYLVCDSCMCSSMMQLLVSQPTIVHPAAGWIHRHQDTMFTNTSSCVVQPQTQGTSSGSFTTQLLAPADQCGVPSKCCAAPSLQHPGTWHSNTHTCGHPSPQTHTHTHRQMRALHTYVTCYRATC